MRNFDVLLWDIDGTLLDFAAAESAAVKSLFREFHLGECSDEMVARYAAINKRWWESLERGEKTKPEILVGRFEEFFAGEGIDAALAPEFNELYQIRLGDTVAFHDDSYGLVEGLRGKIPQYAVSNGTVTAQTRKLKNSGLDRLFDGVFLSEEIGYEKPAREFFDAVFAALGPVDRARTLIVGDSLTSDITGGVRAGIKTCWYNPSGSANETGPQPDYEIRNLSEILAML